MRKLRPVLVAIPIAGLSVAALWVATPSHALVGVHFCAVDGTTGQYVENAPVQLETQQRDGTWSVVRSGPQYSSRGGCTSFFDQPDFQTYRVTANYVSSTFCPVQGATPPGFAGFGGGVHLGQLTLICTQQAGPPDPTPLPPESILTPTGTLPMTASGQLPAALSRSIADTLVRFRGRLPSVSAPPGSGNVPFGDLTQEIGDLISTYTGGGACPRAQLNTMILTTQAMQRGAIEATPEEIRLWEQAVGQFARDMKWRPPEPGSC